MSHICIWTCDNAACGRWESGRESPPEGWLRIIAQEVPGARAHERQGGPAGLLGMLSAMGVAVSGPAQSEPPAEKNLCDRCAQKATDLFGVALARHLEIPAEAPSAVELSTADLAELDDADDDESE